MITMQNVPAQHQSAFAGLDPSAQATILEVINDVIALANKIKPSAVTFPTIPWAQLLALLPQIIAAFSDSTKWPAVIAAILALFFPNP